MNIILLVDEKKERDLYPPDQRIAMGQMPSLIILLCYLDLVWL